MVIKVSKRKIGILFSLFLIFMFIGCESLNTLVLDIDKFKVSYVVNNGSLNDGSLAQLGAEGLGKVAAEEKLKLNIVEINKDDEKDFKKQLIKTVKSSDLIVIVGERFEDVVNEVATNYRDKKFIVTTNKVRESNVQNIIFKYEEGGFLVGSLASSKINNKDIGYISTDDNDLSKMLLAGYMSGIKINNKEATNKLLEGKNISYIKDYCNDKIIYDEVKKLYDSGCEVVLIGPNISIKGAIDAAKDTNKYLINSGKDILKEDIEHSKNILGSLEINFNDILYSSVKDSINGNFKSGVNNNTDEGLKNFALDIKVNEKLSDTKTISTINTYKAQIIIEKLNVPKTKEEVYEFRL